MEEIGPIVTFQEITGGRQYRHHEIFFKNVFYMEEAPSKEALYLGEELEAKDIRSLGKKARSDCVAYEIEKRAIKEKQMLPEDLFATLEEHKMAEEYERLIKENQLGHKANINYTHFVCIPFYQSSQLHQNFIQFKTLLVDNPVLNMDLDFFITPQLMHLTMLMLPLERPEKYELAINTMKELQSKIQEMVKENKIILSFTGLNVMKRYQMEEAKLLFSNIAKNESYVLIQNIADIVIKGMIKSKAIEPTQLSHIEYDALTDKYSLNYHLTLMNSKFKERLRGKGNYSFNAQKIIERHEKYSLGEVIVDRIELVKRGEYDQHTHFYTTQYQIML